MQITAHTVVAMRFRMTNSRGEVLENIMDASPVRYLHGDGSILPALELEITGLRAGDRKTILISQEKGYVEAEEEFYVDVVIDAVRKATEEELIHGLRPQISHEDCGPDCHC